MITWTYWEGRRPPIIDRCIASIREHNSDVRVLSPGDIRKMPGGHELTDELANTYPAARADVIRLWLLATRGGQWIDADTICLRPLGLYDRMKAAGCTLAGYGTNDNPRLGNAILAAESHSPAVTKAYRTARDIVRMPGRVPWGATGQRILGGLLETHGETILREAHDHYAIPWPAWRKYLLRTRDWWHERAPRYNPGAYCYHLTGKTCRALGDLDERALMESDTFTGFLLRKAFGQVKPGRARAILKRLPRDRPIRGAEVGVLAGYLSRVILQQRPLLHLTMVDLWAQQPLDGSYVKSGDVNAVKSEEEWERLYGAAQRAVAFAVDRVTILRMDSVEAAKRIPDGSLDFVFIDGDHSYEGCRRDIEAWAPKVKPGGWCGGHDYNDRWGVMHAANEWAIGLMVETDLDFTWFITYIDC